MRVKGNVSPNVLDIETYSPLPGYVEVRLRENINEISVTDEMSESAITMYAYDEYVFVLKDKKSLKKEIEANVSDWLATGRTLEVNESASILMDMKDALGIMGVRV